VTIFGQDCSHFDAPDTRPAVVEGMRFLTHKAGGDRDDAEYAAWWGYVNGYTPDKVLLGAYWVLYPGNPAGRADAFLARLDDQSPGWRDRPFILQVDCEIWGGDTSSKPGRGDIETFCDRLHSRMPKLRPIVYAPRWAYHDELAGLSYPLWASSYVSGTGSAAILYPGDTSTRWGAYSGQTPAILQYSSSATIGGQTTCDANAYRGTLAQLTALLAPGWETDMPITNADVDVMLKRDAITNPRQRGDAATNPQTTWGFAVADAWQNTYDLKDAVNAVRANQDLYQKAIVAAIANADDGAAVIDAVNRRAEELIAAAKAGEADMEARDAENVARLLTAIQAVSTGGTITQDMLVEALQTVFGKAFGQARTLTAARRRAAEDDETRRAREARQPGIAGTGA
jgi:hypothetical protein